MLWRLLSWLALIAVAWWLFRHREAPGRPAMRGRKDGDGRALRPPEQMVDCVHCGVHLPASEALRDAAGQPYCSSEHRDSGPRVQG